MDQHFRHKRDHKRDHRSRLCGLTSDYKAWLVLCLVLVLGLPGCGGCRRDPAKAKEELEKKLAEERAKKKKEEEPDFEGIRGGPPRLTTRPSSSLAMESSQAGTGWPAAGGVPAYKPGHWTATTLAIKSNKYDFLGELAAAATSPKGEPLSLAGTEFELRVSRQVSLPKRQPKVLESTLFVPLAAEQAMVSWELDRSGGGRAVWAPGPQRLAVMPSYQYHFVVLARWPARYLYLKGLPSVKPPAFDLADVPTEPYYRVALVGDQKQALLPSYGLLWTSIACLLWDGADPDVLTLEQQQALLDWLHWGGQLILSGPETVDVLKNSFLGEYLPATAAPGVTQLGEADFQELQRWANGNKSVRPLVKGRELDGIRLRPRPQAEPIVGSGGLLVERRVGRGRIVMSAFRLSGELVSQPGFDEVFNAFLLRRPGRRFTEDVEQGSQVTWADAPAGRLDAALISKLRYFTRDAGVRSNTYGADTRTGDLGVYEDLPAASGVAGWNDSGPVANSARKALLGAAQVEIPRADFVLWIVAGYLLVLVPVNWAVFRLVGRVEWAWVAAPVIAVVCTAVVIRAARLDIGFARSRTEIVVVELQGGYQRAHVTRYTALYTALTTHYDFHFEDPGALVLPFPKRSLETGFATHRMLQYRREEEASLLDYYVRSNSTGLVHSEQMLDVGGALSLRKTAQGGWQVLNQTSLTLHDAAVVGRNQAGELQAAWLGTLEPGAVVRPKLRRRLEPLLSDRLLCQEHYRYDTLSGRNLSPGELNLRELLVLAQGLGKDGPPGDLAVLGAGDMRLVAGLKLEDGIPGQVIDPAAPQAQVAGLVVAHLQYGHGADPQPDTYAAETPHD